MINQAKDFIKRNRRQIEREYGVSPWLIRGWIYGGGKVPWQVATMIADTFGAPVEQLGLRVRVPDIGNGPPKVRRMSMKTQQLVDRWRATYEACGRDVGATARALGHGRDIVRWVCEGGGGQR